MSCYQAVLPESLNKKYPNRDDIRPTVITNNHNYVFVLTNLTFTWRSCCVFRPAFGCCAQPRAGQNLFTAVFWPFLFISKLFQWFHGWIHIKNVWKWTKKRVYVYSSTLVDKQKLVDSMRRYLKIVYFRLIFYFF